VTHPTELCRAEHVAAIVSRVGIALIRAAHVRHANPRIREDGLKGPEAIRALRSGRIGTTAAFVVSTSILSRGSFSDESKEI